MPNLIYQAVCYTESSFIGPKTLDHQQAFQDEQNHLNQFPDHNVDIQITQSFGMTGQNVDPDDIAPFEDE
jgi:hypothetical protein